MSEVTHLNQESKILPVKEHSEMLTKQYLLSMHTEDHPNHHLLHFPRPPRDKRKSILDYIPSIAENTGHRTVLTKEEYKRENRKIHSETVRTVINNYPANKVLNSKPPEINQSEKELPRDTRTTLAQLRSSYSPFLKTYLHRINRSDSDLCPHCQRNAHTTNHLFECPSNPTNLRPNDLWTNPKLVAEFLNLPVNQATPDDVMDPG